MLLTATRPTYSPVPVYLVFQLTTFIEIIESPVSVSTAPMSLPVGLCVSSALEMLRDKSSI